MVKAQKNAPAFTLIELVVVMAIIAVLVSLSVLGITIINRSSRDNQRTTTLNAINLLIESYNGTYGGYPAKSLLNYDSATKQFYLGANLAAAVSSSSVVQAIGASVADFSGTSQAGTDYCYTQTGSTYSLGTTLESGGNKYYGTTIAANQCNPATSATGF